MVPLLALATSVLPTLARYALGDNAGAIADKASAAAKVVFGTDEPEAIKAAIVADPTLEHAFRMKLAEVEDAERQREHERFMASIADVGNARGQTIELAKAGSPIAWGAPVVSALVLATFGVVLYLVFTAKIPPGQERIADTLVGILGTLAVSVVSYWVGSSVGSARKDNTLADLKSALLASPPPGGPQAGR